MSGALPARAVPLLRGALTALNADLGAKCIGWETTGSGKKARVYRRRLELLAEALEPGTLEVVIRWLSSSRRTSVSTRRGYADDLLSDLDPAGPPSRF